MNLRADVVAVAAGIAATAWLDLPDRGVELIAPVPGCAGSPASTAPNWWSR